MGDRGEVVELAAFRDVYASLQEGGYGRVADVAGAVCGAIPVLRDVLMVNRVLGLGLERRATQDAWRRSRTSSAGRARASTSP